MLGLECPAIRLTLFKSPPCASISVMAACLKAYGVSRRVMPASFLAFGRLLRTDLMGFPLQEIMKDVICSPFDGVGCPLSVSCHFCNTGRKSVWRGTALDGSPFLRADLMRIVSWSQSTSDHVRPKSSLPGRRPV